MSQKLKPSPAQPEQKRQWGTAMSCLRARTSAVPGSNRAAFGRPGSAWTETYSSSSYDLDYELYRDNIPYLVYGYQRIPPLINHMPVKIQRTYVGMGVQSSFSPHKGPRNSHLPPRRIKLQTEELHSIRGKLSQIKAQVDHLLESLERMDQQRDHHPGTENSDENSVPGSKGSSCTTTDPQQELRGQRAHPEVDGYEENTDSEEAMKNHSSNQEGSP